LCIHTSRTEHTILRFSKLMQLSIVSGLPSSIKIISVRYTPLADRGSVLVSGTVSLSLTICLSIITKQVCYFIHVRQTRCLGILECLAIGLERTSGIHQQFELLEFAHIDQCQRVFQALDGREIQARHYAHQSIKVAEIAQILQRAACTSGKIDAQQQPIVVVVLVTAAAHTVAIRISLLIIAARSCLV
jgi:hypothetical protein